MFTGLITAVGTVTRVVGDGGGRELTIEAPYPDLRPGESVAVNGACLTVEGTGPAGFTVRVITTTLGRTRFGEMEQGATVNLERALAVGDRLGGHIVQGHVDGVGRVVDRRRQDDALLLDIEVPGNVAAVTIPLGSIAVDGVSLTVNAIPRPGVVQISLIPVTLEATTLGSLSPGDDVHLEGDAIGKYVVALLGPRLGAAAPHGQQTT